MGKPSAEAAGFEGFVEKCSKLAAASRQFQVGKLAGFSGQIGPVRNFWQWVT
jgi:hypothetical protein